jgi:tetratricopeptide (TPR) repeat protein
VAIKTKPMVTSPPYRLWLAPSLYFLVGFGIIWGAHSRIFVREDALEIPNYCGWLQNAPFSGVLLSRAVGESGPYYRPLEDIFLSVMAKRFDCFDAQPYRIAAGLIWLLCAASIVIPLRRAGVHSDLAWTAAGLLMLHPYNSWYFISPLLIAGALLIPAAVGAWSAFEAAERGSGLTASAFAAACVYVACLSRENAVMIPVAMSVAAVGFQRVLTRRTVSVLLASAAAAGLYLMQRRWVLIHDPPLPAAMFQWDSIQKIGAAYSSYLWVLLTGDFRVYGGMIPSQRALGQLALWLVAASAAAFLPKRRHRAFIWIALFCIWSSEIAASALLNGEILPVRATGSIAFILALSVWAVSRMESAREWRLTLLFCAVPGVIWAQKSFRHVLASREAYPFLEIHSNPPYSWKFEGERVGEWLARGDPRQALAAAQASERLRPSWLPRTLRASLEAIYFGPRSLDELRELMRAGAGEPAAQIGYVNLGVAFGRNTAWSEADDCFRRATVLAPNYSQAWSQWAWAEVARKNWAQGAAFAQKAVELNPGDLDGWQNLGYSRTWLHDWRAASEAYQREFASLPPLPATRIYWAFDLERLGKPEQAWDSLMSTPDLSADPFAAAYLGELAPNLRRHSPLAVNPRVTAQLQALQRQILEASR